MAQKGKKMRDVKREQLLRMNIIASMIKRGHSYREMRQEVMARLDLSTYSLKTVSKDVNRVLEEWREMRIKDADLALQLELERIDELIKEAWEMWEKSKQSYDKARQKITGIPTPPPTDENGKPVGNQSGEPVMVKVEKTTEGVEACGDPRYLELINKLLIERRKLLGLYSPEKREVQGEFSFANLLMETGIIDV